MEQIRRFGPCHDRFKEIADADRILSCTAAIVYFNENRKWLPFAKSVDKELAQPDREFIARITKLDPRDRPTAKELLQDSWLEA